MKAWGLSDVGVARELNEDTFAMYPDSNPALFVVCDGMGGANAGEVASQVALDTFTQSVLEKGTLKNQEQMKKTLHSATDAANDAVFQMALGNSQLEGMGTTLVALLCTDDTAVVGNVGDSRAYILDEEGIRQITTDHSLVSEMIKRGELTPYQAQRYPNRNLITRALGVDQSVKCDLFGIRPSPGTYLLLCSDGLTNEISDPEIYYEVYQRESPDTACSTLIEMANARGGHDNITVILVAF